MPLMEQYIGDWLIEDHTLTLSTAAVVPLLPADTKRWSILLSVTSGNVYVGPNSTLSASAPQRGLVVNANSVLQLTYQSHGAMIQGQWFATPVTLGTIITCYVSRLMR